MERFYEQYKLFGLCRYNFVDEVPDPEPVQDAILKQGVPARPVIAVDYGNKSNYLAGEEVVISVFREGESTVELCRNGEVLERVTLTGPGKFTRTPERGYYTVRLADTGDTAQFCVNQAKISFTVHGGNITVKADPCDPDSRIVYMDFREASKAQRGESRQTDAFGAKVAFHDPRAASVSTVEELTDTEKQTGVFTRPIPSDARNFKVYFKNKYGVWVHPMTEL